ncbi:hypothetical protein ACLTEW_10645 [Gordonia lacunae]|uniref:hypothetical protein n=1 Tax=Gordonia lacunae TaxID=417102 RepID=UPI0039E34B02
MSARDWRSLITEAATLLDDTWHIIGTGRRTYLLRTPVEWWVQFLSYENTAVGRLIGYQAFLGCPVSISQTGDRGVSGDSYIMPGEPRRRLARDLLTPTGIADFARAVTDTHYHPVTDLHAELHRSEETLEFRRSKGQEWIYEGSLRQRLVALRVVCASRTRAELIDDVQWVLDDPACDSHPTLSSPKGTARAASAFFTDVRDALINDDRAQVEHLITTARAETLTIIGVPDHHIAPLVFPPPLVTT